MRSAATLFRETATVTTLRAGSARNVIPGELVANLNYRYPPGWDRVPGARPPWRSREGADEVRLLDEAPSGAIPLDRPLFAAFVEGCGRRAGRNRPGRMWRRSASGACRP